MTIIQARQGDKVRVINSGCGIFIDTKSPDARGWQHCTNLTFAGAKRLAEALLKAVER